jgi:hypothetical protein
LEDEEIVSELQVLEFNIAKNHCDNSDKAFEDFLGGFTCILPHSSKKLPILLKKEEIQEQPQDPFADPSTEWGLIEVVHGSNKGRKAIASEFLNRFPNISKRALQKKMRSIAKKGSLVNPRLFELLNCTEEFFTLLQNDFDGLRESLPTELNKENFGSHPTESIFNEILIDLVKSTHSVSDSKNVLPEKICKKYEGANPVKVVKSHIETKMKDISKTAWCVSPEIYFKHVSIL